MGKKLAIFFLVIIIGAAGAYFYMENDKDNKILTLIKNEQYQEFEEVWKELELKRQEKLDAKAVDLLVVQYDNMLAAEDFEEENVIGIMRVTNLILEITKNNDWKKDLLKTVDGYGNVTLIPGNIDCLTSNREALFGAIDQLMDAIFGPLTRFTQTKNTADWNLYSDGMNAVFAKFLKADPEYEYVICQYPIQTTHNSIFNVVAHGYHSLVMRYNDYTDTRYEYNVRYANDFKDENYAELERVKEAEIKSHEDLEKGLALAQEHHDEIVQLRKKLFK